MELWKLKPIVGEIRDCSAVILYELYDKNQQVYFLINDDDKKHAVKSTMMGPTKITLKFKQEDDYHLYWYLNNQLSLHHHIHVFNKVDKMIVVSCDHLENDQKHSLWQDINYHVLKQNVAIVHLGDQAYQDTQFKTCVKLEKKYKSYDNMKDKLKLMYYQLYANRYCDTWRPHSHVLSNTRNYYLWDDHEIVNDVIYDQNNDIHVMAAQAYKDYQMSFLIDENQIIINDYCWYTYINHDVIMVAIERTSQSIAISNVINIINNLFNHDDLKTLILCFSSAPIPPPHHFHGFVYKTIQGTGKFWNKHDLTILLNCLFKYVDDKKHVILLGGDVHFGVHGYYVNHINHIIPVIIASPITNSPATDRKLAARGMIGQFDIDSDIQFIGVKAKAKRCYGVIDFNDGLLGKTDVMY
ncbi:MAG TPA: hypothetical protein VLG50_05515 [Candidatus Saccharimonadales bacterium]|nr:hypothetical protein [Candidatus Saccharimonadales bacterium]